MAKNKQKSKEKKYEDKTGGLIRKKAFAKCNKSNQDQTF